MKFTRSKLIQSDDRFKIWEYRGLRVVLDRHAVVPDDPGADTPAMVYLTHRDMEACATYWCALGEASVYCSDGKHRGDHRLSDNQCAWLDSLEPELTEFLYDTNPICQKSA
jgi:hypothetical protein